MDDVPSAQRALERAWVLSCLVARGSIEGKDDVKGREATRRAVLSWFDAMGLQTEAEPSELAILRTRIGKLEPQTAIDCTWACEAIVVLLWALHEAEVGPAHAQVPDPRAIVGATGYLDEAGARELAARASMRPQAEIAAYAEQARNVHWRLRRLRAGVAAYDCTRVFDDEAPERVAPVELVEGDLAFDGTPVGRVARPVIASALSIAAQRQRASSWLEGDAQLYSEVVLDT
ncbi:MAG: DUF4272 domain-containing protein [Polyangiaceae bacterium]|nr:DUF4272 domain-containing protein [Polyangiaceae bacterium]